MRKHITLLHAIPVPGHSVHFEEDDDGQPVPHPGDDDLDEFKDCPQSSTDIPPENSSCGLSSSLVDLSDVVNNRTKRNLDQWQYAEHMEPSILLQVCFDWLQVVQAWYSDNMILTPIHLLRWMSFRSTIGSSTDTHLNSYYTPLTFWWLDSDLLRTLLCDNHLTRCIVHEYAGAPRLADEWCFWGLAFTMTIIIDW